VVAGRAGPRACVGQHLRRAWGHAQLAEGLPAGVHGDEQALGEAGGSDPHEAHACRSQLLLQQRLLLQGVPCRRTGGGRRTQLLRRRRLLAARPRPWPVLVGRA
jgi:hypothetical protein